MSNFSSVLERFNLDECVEWIKSNRANSVCLYFLPQFYSLATDIVIVLRKNQPDTDFLVMISGSSGVDTIKYRVSNQKFLPDAVIYFGATCLCPSNYSSTLPLLFVPLSACI